MDESEKHNELMEQDKALKDRGGRRRIPDRRKYSSSDHFPERRILRHRRGGSDRRNRQNLRIQRSKERRQAFRELSFEEMPFTDEQE